MSLCVSSEPYSDQQCRILRFAQCVEQNCRYYLARDGSLSDLASFHPRSGGSLKSTQDISLLLYQDAFEEITNLQAPSEFVIFHSLEIA
jgi:hypothetical protein